MENKILKFVGYWAMSLLLLICTVITIRWIANFLDWARFEAGDLGTWVGAVGTVGALLGTLWIASDQARSTAKAEQTRARLQAAAMSTRLIHVSGDLRRACETLHLEYPANPLAVFDVCESMLSSIDVWDVEDVMPLIPLPGGVAPLLAQAADSIKSLRRVLALQKTSGDLATPEGRAEFIEGFCGQIERIRKFVNSGQEACQDAALELMVERWDSGGRARS